MAFVHHTDSGNDYTRRGGAGGRPRRLRLPHQVAALERRRLQLPDRPLRHHLRGPLRRRRRAASIGAQVLGFNTGSTGISVIGTFTSATPPSAAVTSLERLLEWKLDVHHVDPQGTGDARLRLRAEVRDRAARHVPGHRRASRRQLHGLPRRAAVRPAAEHAQGRRAHRASPRSTASSWTTRPSAPTATACATSHHRLHRLADRHLAPRDPRRRRRVGAAHDRRGRRSWRPRGRAGTTTASALPDGVYTLQADATSADGEARSGHGDAAPGHGRRPSIESAAVAPDPFSPNGDGQDDVATARASSRARPGRLASPSSTPTATVAAPRDGLEGGDGGRPDSVSWDGRISSGSGAHGGARGRGPLLLELRDGPATPPTRERTVTVDRTLTLTSSLAQDVLAQRRRRRTTPSRSRSGSRGPRT